MGIHIQLGNVKLVNEDINGTSRLETVFLEECWQRINTSAQKVNFMMEAIVRKLE